MLPYVRKYHTYRTYMYILCIRIWFSCILSASIFWNKVKKVSRTHGQSLDWWLQRSCRQKVQFSLLISRFRNLWIPPWWRGIFLLSRELSIVRTEEDWHWILHFFAAVLFRISFRVFSDSCNLCFRYLYTKTSARWRYRTLTLISRDERCNIFIEIGFCGFEEDYRPMGRMLLAILRA